MMYTITITLNHQVRFGQQIYIYGSLPELGLGEESQAVSMNNASPSSWSISLQTSEKMLSYHFLVKENGEIVASEWGSPHCVQLSDVFNSQNDGLPYVSIQDSWHEIPQDRFAYSSAFEVINGLHSDNHEKFNPQLQKEKRCLVVNVRCPHIHNGQELIMIGAPDWLGAWQPAGAIRLKQSAETKNEWVAELNAEQITELVEYKFAVYDKSSKTIAHWEEGENRLLKPIADKTVEILNVDYRLGGLDWKVSGVAIPVFSLRSKSSFGIGEFSDLRLMVDWAIETGMKIIQVLPINDTTISHTWLDSYPYNAISIYALHPIYLGLSDFPLTNKKLLSDFRKKADLLNKLETVDYEQVLRLKLDYLQQLFEDRGETDLKSNKYQSFYEKNKTWLFPYACFSFFRDKFGTADYGQWPAEFRHYDEEALNKLIKHDNQMASAIRQIYFTQYLLHIQLSGIKEYANNREVVLKGDIPIGISRSSVDAWVEPHLFNLDKQTGAPPDVFSTLGQNWGFPTYNWNEMSKDGYQWWTKRFCKMADYFDAYRIDHILGFFRIWEIPMHSVQGLLGYFSPALPLAVEEINHYGMVFDEDRMTKPYIHQRFLDSLFEEYVEEAIANHLVEIGKNRYMLREHCNTQKKIKEIFGGANDERINCLREGLYHLCNEVLFIKAENQPENEPERYHPRILAQNTFSFEDLNEAEKQAFSALYVQYFYQRHSQFWREEAMRKLPTLIASTGMLVCGEDLGMIPDCVPSVMDELQILRLEIQRMPKDINSRFENLNNILYLSVCTTSTHDMSPLREWWRDDRDEAQHYYNEILWKNGDAPYDCPPELCKQILVNHLNSSAMLVIIPLQDWLSMSGNLRRTDPDEERINVPATAQHYWRYRMHLNIEDLLSAKDFNEELKGMMGNR